LKYERLHIVFGVVGDKDIGSMLDLLPKKAQYYFTKAKIPRALDENSLFEKAKVLGLKGRKFATVRKALNAAKVGAGERDLIFIGGSTFVVGEII